MRMPRRINEAPARNWIEPGPEVTARMALVNEPPAAIVACYTLTRGAERAWCAINHQLTQARGELFWIGGEAGSGKTHFLNYVVALSNHAAASDTVAGRYLTVIADVSAQASGGDLDRQLLDQLALQLAGDSREASLWRRVSGAEGLAIAFDYARRQGVKGITAAVDLGEQEVKDVHAQINTLATVAREFKQLRLIVLAAGRSPDYEGFPSFVVAPADDEVLAVICGRARRLNDNAWPQAALLYRGLELGGHEPRQIYPLHPAAAEGLKRLRTSGAVLSTGAALLRESIVLWDAAKRHDWLLTPADLMRSASVRRELERNLGEAGSAGLALARRAAAELPEVTQTAGNALIDTLAWHHLCSTSGLALSTLLECLPKDAMITAGGGDRMLAELSARSNGIIRFEAGQVYFNPQAAGTPEMAAFNQALALARHFDSSLTAASDISELKIKSRRLAEALTTAVERCYRNRELIAAALHNGNGGLSREQQRTFDAFGEMAESGVAALIELAADPERRDAALKVIADYDAMAVVALAAPRLRAIGEYLEATSLAASFEGDPAKDPVLAALETECQLLKAAVAPAALLSSGRNLGALESRFHQFKWTYMRLYREAHFEWRRKLKQLALITDEIRLHLGALGRLNRIAALGEPVAQDLNSRMEVISSGIRDCDADDEMALEVRPRCLQCDFSIGAHSPRIELQELFEQTQRALNAKLARLSHSAITRLIEEHDANGRLEGFLKITQAAQTEALIRVLDDKLATYLDELLNENRMAGAVNGSAGIAPQVLTASGSVRRTRPTALRRGEKSAKQ